MHPARKTLRGILLFLLTLSLGFFATVVYLRVSYHGKRMDQAMQDRMFTVDVLQHRVRAYFSDDEGDVAIARELFKLGFFSPIYTDAGAALLKEKALEGYEPAKDLLATLPPEYQ